MKKKRPKKYEQKLFIDMPFDEALERFIGVDPQEVRANIEKEKGGRKKKPPGSKPSGGRVESQNVVRLRDRRKLHNG